MSADWFARCEQIVRGLAHAGEPLDGEFGDCLLCGAEPKRKRRRGVEQADLIKAQQHEGECPWRLAVEITATGDSAG